MPLERFERQILIESTLDKLTHAPLRSNEVKAILPLMREELVEKGVNLELSETALKSLRKPKFRSLTAGRGPGVVEALGQEKAEKVLTWCREQGGPRLRKNKKSPPIEGSQGRGLRQLTADTVLLLSNSTPSAEDIEKYTLRLNRRVKKGIIYAAKSEEVRQHFRDVFTSVPDIPDSKKWADFSSVPPGSVKKLWDFLTQK